MFSDSTRLLTSGIVSRKEYEGTGPATGAVSGRILICCGREDHIGGRKNSFDGGGSQAQLGADDTYTQSSEKNGSGLATMSSTFNCSIKFHFIRFDTLA